MTVTDNRELRAAKILHDAVDQILHHSERQRRNTFTPPKYPADMSVTNTRLEQILAEMDAEPPC